MQIRSWIFIFIMLLAVPAREAFAAEAVCVDVYSIIGKGAREKGLFRLPEQLRAPAQVSRMPSVATRARAAANVPPPTPAATGMQRMLMVNDLDGNIVQLWHSAKEHELAPAPSPPAGFKSYTIRFMENGEEVTETYIAADTTLKLLGEAQGRGKTKGVDLHMAFFSGGTTERNDALLKAIQVSDGKGKSTSLYDMSRAPDGRARVLNRDDVLYVKKNIEAAKKSGRKMPESFKPSGAEYLDESRLAELQPFDGSLLVKDLEKFGYPLDEVAFTDDHVFFSGIKDQSGNLIRSMAMKPASKTPTHAEKAAAARLTADDWENRMVSLVDHAIGNRSEGKPVQDGLAQRQFRVERGADGKPRLVFDPARYDAKNRNIPGSVTESSAASRSSLPIAESADVRRLARKYGVWASTDEADLATINKQLADRWQPSMHLAEFRANMYESFVINRVAEAGNSTTARAALLAEDAADLPLLASLSLTARSNGVKDGIAAARRAISDAGSTGRVLEVDPAQAQAARNAFREAYVNAAKGQGADLTAVQREADRLAEICLAGGACAADIAKISSGPGVDAIRDARATASSSGASRSDPALTLAGLPSAALRGLDPGAEDIRKAAEARYLIKKGNTAKPFSALTEAEQAAEVRRVQRGVDALNRFFPDRKLIGDHPRNAAYNEHRNTLAHLETELHGPHVTEARAKVIVDEMIRSKEEVLKRQGMDFVSVLDANGQRVLVIIGKKGAIAADPLDLGLNNVALRARSVTDALGSRRPLTLQELIRARTRLAGNNPKQAPPPFVVYDPMELAKNRAGGMYEEGRNLIYVGESFDDNLHEIAHFNVSERRALGRSAPGYGAEVEFLKDASGKTILNHGGYQHGAEIEELRTLQDSVARNTAWLREYRDLKAAGLPMPAEMHTAAWETALTLTQRSHSLEELESGFDVALQAAQKAVLANVDEAVVIGNGKAVITVRGADGVDIARVKVPVSGLSPKASAAEKKAALAKAMDSMMEREFGYHLADDNTPTATMGAAFARVQLLQESDRMVKALIDDSVLGKLAPGDGPQLLGLWSDVRLRNIDTEDLKTAVSSLKDPEANRTMSAFAREGMLDLEETARLAASGRISPAEFWTLLNLPRSSSTAAELAWRKPNAAARPQLHANPDALVKLASVANRTEAAKVVDEIITNLELEKISPRFVPLFRRQASKLYKPESTTHKVASMVLKAKNFQLSTESNLGPFSSVMYSVSETTNRIEVSVPSFSLAGLDMGATRAASVDTAKLSIGQRSGFSDFISGVLLGASMRAAESPGKLKQIVFTAGNVTNHELVRMLNRDLGFTSPLRASGRLTDSDISKFGQMGSKTVASESKRNLTLTIGDAPAKPGFFSTMRSYVTNWLDHKRAVSRALASEPPRRIFDVPMATPPSKVNEVRRAQSGQMMSRLARVERSGDVPLAQAMTNAYDDAIRSGSSQAEAAAARKKLFEDYFMEQSLRLAGDDTARADRVIQHTKDVFGSAAHEKVVAQRGQLVKAIREVHEAQAAKGESAPKLFQYGEKDADEIEEIFRRNGLSAQDARLCMASAMCGVVPDAKSGSWSKSKSFGWTYWSREKVEDLLKSKRNKKMGTDQIVKWAKDTMGADSGLVRYRGMAVSESQLNDIKTKGLLFEKVQFDKLGTHPIAPGISVSSDVQMAAAHILPQEQKAIPIIVVLRKPNLEEHLNKFFKEAYYYTKDVPKEDILGIYALNYWGRFTQVYSSDLARASAGLPQAKASDSFSRVLASDPARVAVVKPQGGRLGRFKLYDTLKNREAVYVGIADHPDEGQHHWYLMAGGTRLDGKPLQLPNVKESKTGNPLASRGVLFEINTDKDTVAAVEAAIQQSKGMRTISCLHAVCQVLEKSGVVVETAAKERRSVKPILAALYEGKVSVNGEKLGPEQVRLFATSQKQLEDFLANSEIAEKDARTKLVLLAGIPVVTGGMGYALYAITPEDAAPDLKKP